MMTTAMTMPGRLLVIASLALGCGGKHGDTTPSGGGGGAAAEAEHADASSEMVPPETTDQIKRSLERKRPTVSRCLSIAVDNKELPRNAAGKITLEIVISPAGRADSVHVVRATLESKSLADCVIARIKEIQFPELPRPYETSYTYGFEAM
jgi:hypothetical protein